MVIHPNVFVCVPDSPGRSMDFFVRTETGRLFPSTERDRRRGGGGLALTWRLSPVRWWMVERGDCYWEFAYGARYFWPRNEIMFTAGAAVPSVGTLRRDRVRAGTLGTFLAARRATDGEHSA